MVVPLHIPPITGADTTASANQLPNMIHIAEACQPKLKRRQSPDDGCGNIRPVPGQTSSPPGAVGASADSVNDPTRLVSPSLGSAGAGSVITAGVQFWTTLTRGASHRFQ
jgi:hypothetical protein